MTRGLIGPREVPRLWDRHLLNCATLASAIPERARVADVGSGAGLPGLVVAILRPDVEMTLIEPLRRRTSFLDEVVEELALPQVHVVRGRAESLHGGERFDVVTSRAVAPLERLLGWCLPLVAPTGCMLALKGSSAADEVAAARSAWQGRGCAPPEVLRLEGVAGGEPTCAVRVAWADPASVSWPVGSPEGSRRGSAPSSPSRSDRARKRRPRRDR